ncbi:hypothetical protein S1OALGB6SA_531 [Olavius algarvensis spirochete endosymbiont]|nr:hypothetical protein JY97_11820 [Alkalispirochaeta odontotermitis]VDA99463.1 hypothetical protein S1OALGB6SA_531 [Olavius algarvensis spirochete endosymbiont]
MLFKMFRLQYRTLFATVLLLSTCFSPIQIVFAQAPSEARGFSKGNLHLYPLGWSSEGRWGTLIGTDRKFDQSEITILVIDAVTDEILHRSNPLPWSGQTSLDVFWERYGRRVDEIIATYKLESSLRPDVRDARLYTGGYTYEFVLEASEQSNRGYSLSIKSSRGDSKEVYNSPPDKRANEVKLLGAVVSPFESRALAIVYEGDSYRFIGAHLTLGFIRISNEASTKSNSDAMISAIINGQIYLVRNRLAAGLNPNQKDSRGYSGVLIAARLGHWHIMADLLAAGALPVGKDSEGRTALHYAAFAQNEEAIRKLLSAGSNPRTKDNAGLSPAQLIARPELKSLLE